MLAITIEDRARAMSLTPRQAADPISETIAGRMALRGLLTRIEAEAANEYARLVASAHAAILSPARPKCSLNQSRSGGGADDVWRYSEAMRRYQDAFVVISMCGERANRIINLIVRDEIEPSGGDIAELCIALKALAGHFGFDRANAA